MAFYIVSGIVGLIVIWLIAIYNGLVRRGNRCQEAWSDIDVQLKRRYNLIPNLVNTVKGYAKHERETLEKVIKARNQAQQARGAKAKSQAENMLSQTLRSLFALSENYPDLKASQNFLELQRELRDTEDKIMAARRFYNRNVRDFNIKTQTFPSRIIANIFNFQKKELFELADEAARSVPEVSF